MKVPGSAPPTSPGAPGWAFGPRGVPQPSAWPRYRGSPHHLRPRRGLPGSPTRRHGGSSDSLECPAVGCEWAGRSRERRGPSEGAARASESVLDSKQAPKNTARFSGSAPGEGASKTSVLLRVSPEGAGPMSPAWCHKAANLGA